MSESEYSVELVSPSGRKVISTSPRETVDLVYGHGYKDASGKDSGQVTDVNYKGKGSKAKGSKASSDEGTS
jgi:hypothetical protein